MSGYLIAQLNMTDKESFKLYAETVPESVKKFGGKYLVRAGESLNQCKENGILQEM